jgi:D-alanine-D-alanine ligase
MKRLLKVAVVYGGRGSEHEVSLASARNVLAALDPKRFRAIPVKIPKRGPFPQVALTKADVIFPIVHGTGGEDGALQGYLETLDKPYVGCGIYASAVCLHKGATKRILRDAGIPVAESFTVRPASNARECVAEAKCLGYPVFVKPCRQGSSIGITKVKRPGELAAALKEAFRWDNLALIERAMPNARELEVAVLGNGPYEIAGPGEIIPTGEFYDYQAKYGGDGSPMQIPARIPERLAETLRTAAWTAAEALEIEGLSRVDFLLDGQTGDWVLNEINTLPGFTDISMYPELWRLAGLPGKKLVTRLIELALERHRQQQNNVTASGT